MYSGREGARQWLCDNGIRAGVTVVNDIGFEYMSFDDGLCYFVKWDYVNSRFASKELTKGISGKKEESKHNMFIIRCRILGDVVNKAYYVKANLGYGALGGFTWVDNFKNTVFFFFFYEAKVFWVKVKSLLGLDKFPLVDPDSVKIVEISLKEKDRLSF